MEIYNVAYAEGCGDGVYTQNHEMAELGELATYCKPVADWLRKRGYATNTKVIISKFGAEFMGSEMYIPFAEGEE